MSNTKYYLILEQNKTDHLEIFINGSLKKKRKTDKRRDDTDSEKWLN